MIGARPYTDTEIELVLNQLSRNRDKCLFILGIRTGFRISELLSITLSDILKYNEIGAQLTVKRSSMKGKVSSRTVPLHSQARDYLSIYSAELKASPPLTKLFPFNRKHAWYILNQAIKACKLQGKLGTHSMRKTFADRVFTAVGENIFKTQVALGHKSPSSTVSYLSFKQEEIDAAIVGLK